MKEFFRDRNGWRPDGAKSKLYGGFAIDFYRVDKDVHDPALS